MKTVNIPHAGDMYALTFSITGDLVHVEVARDNRCRLPEPLDPTEVPREVFEKALNKTIERHGKLH